MFIYHFNRMIRNRILWIVFAVVIAIAFLSVDSCYRNPGGRDRGAPDDEGEIGGRPVKSAEYDFARRIVENATRDLSPAATETQIWAHIAAMRTAEEMGITATAAEIRERIASMPDFQDAGVFSPARYEMAVTKALGISTRAFERMQADYIVLFKLMAAVTAGSAPSRMAVDDQVAQYTDTYTFRYATISNAFANAEVEAGDDDLRDYYERNSENFALPDRVKVRYAALAVTNFTPAVALDDIAADVDDYYASDPSRFTRRGTNGVEQLTLEEARPQIVEELTLEEAVHIATTNLAAFMESVATNDLESFSWRAKARGLETRDTPLFAYDASFVPGVESAALEEFRETATDLDASRADAWYGIARGKRNVYLLRIVTNDVAHTPSFESLKETLAPLAVAEKRAKLFDDAADKTYASLKEAMAGKDFREAFPAACESLGLPVSSNITFSASTFDPGQLPDARAILPAVMRLRAGDVSSPVKVFDGAVVVCVESREPSANDFEAQQARGAVESQLARSNDALFFSDWLVWNLTRQGFSSRRLENILADSGADEDDGDDN